jgi:carbon-monoxide dehydrogenase large subunit
VGDRIAYVVAETPAQARDAADMTEVDYEPLPAVALLEDAAKDGAPKVWDDNPDGNVAFQLMIGDPAATDAAFAKARQAFRQHHISDRDPERPRRCLVLRRAVRHCGR